MRAINAGLLEKIDRSTRAAKLREAIEESIATGVFPPGTHLDEREVARRFKVSRTPLREALIQLSSIGVTVMRPRRGVVVAEVTPLRLLEMFEVMAELEALCTRLAARRMSDAHLSLLLRAHEACDAACRAGDPEAYYNKSETFHQAIYADSHSDFLIEQTMALHRRLRPYRRLQLRVRNRMQKSFAEHVKIVEALLANDPHSAADRLRKHVAVQGERFTDILASLANLDGEAITVTDSEVTTGSVMTFLQRLA